MVDDEFSTEPNFCKVHIHKQKKRHRFSRRNAVVYCPWANFLTPASNQYNKQMPLQANNLKTLIKSPNYVYRYYRCTVFICDIDYLLAENQAPIRHAHLIANYLCPTGWYVR